MTAQRLGLTVKTMTSAFAYLVIGAFFVTAVSDMYGVDRLSTSALIAGSLGYVLCSLIMLTTHEYAHAITARSLGQPVSSIEIGTGPTLVRWRWQETVTTLRLLPSSGFTRLGATNLDPRTLTRRRWIFAAGPMINAVQAALAVIVVINLQGLPATFASMFAVVQVSAVLTTLWPRRPTARRPRGSDGWFLWHYRPWGWPARLTQLTIRSDAGDARAAYDALARRRRPRRHAGEWAGQLSTHAYRAGLFEECVQLQARWLERRPVDAGTRAALEAVAADCVLSAALRDGRELEEDELHRCRISLSDPELAPATTETALALEHSRALLLLAEGDAEAALRAGEALLDDEHEPIKPADRALVAAMTAVAAARAGAADAAEYWSGHVPSWCALRPAMQREMAASVPFAATKGAVGGA